MTRARKYVVLGGFAVLMIAAAPLLARPVYQFARTSYAVVRSSLSHMTAPVADSAIPFEKVVIDADISGDVKLVGDIDGDGQNDLVIGGMPGENLVWYRYPDWKKVTIASPGNEFTTDGALGDVDGDGDLDILVPDGDGPDNLLWFENPRPAGAPGDGAAWTRHVVGSIGGWGKDVHPSDYDGDGLLDLATRSKDALMVFFQTAPGTWSRTVIPNVDLGHEGMTHGDVDSDGDADLVLHGVWVRNPGGIAAREGDAWTSFPIGEADSDFKALVTDLDLDGRPDVLFSSSENTADVNWWSPGAEGPTGAWTRHTVVPALEHGHTLQAGDMDGDGDIDLVLAQMHTSPPGKIMVMLNTDGKATAWLEQLVDTGGLHNGVVADIGGDGDLDIFGANWTGNPPVRLWISHLEEMADWSYREVTDQNAQTFGLAFGDVDGDKRTDILSGPFWYRNPGDTRSAHWAQHALPAGDHAILVTDLDGDDRIDVIAQKHEGDIGLHWLEPLDAEGTRWSDVAMGTVPRASHELGAQGYAIGSIDGEGSKDVLISSGDGIYAFKIPADPEKGGWPRRRISANPSDEGFDLGDIDGDGDVDVAGTTGDSKRVEWYENPVDGSEDWTAHRVGSFAQAVFPDRTRVADLDGDGLPDIVVTEENGEDDGAETVWWKNPGEAGGDWSPRTITTQATTNSMDAADVDGDGDIDLVLAEHRGAERLAVWSNDGKGNFTQHLVSLGRESHLGARTVDIDGDGDLDIVSIAWDDFGRIHLWLNQRGGAHP